MARQRHQFGHAFDRVDLGRDRRHYRSRVTGASADLEHALVGTYLRLGDHQRHDVRLGDGLTGLDRQRRVLVGEFTQRRGHEFLARNPTHRLEREWIGHTARGDLALDHALALQLRIAHDDLRRPTHG